MDIFNLPTIKLAHKLLGMELIHESTQGITAGIITEVEVYLGLQDSAAHAYSGNRTKRTELMYGPPGHLCLYCIRGNNIMLNITSGKIDTPEIVFVRALRPSTGIDLMLERRKYSVQYSKLNDFKGSKIKNLTNGPGKMCQAMGITKEFHGHYLGNKPLYLKESIINPVIKESARVNIHKKDESAKSLLRFYITE